LGPNGAGKTTTIRCLLDAIRPTSGTIRVLGIDPQVDPVAVHRKTGYLPGELHLDEGLKAGATLRYLAALRDGAMEWDYALGLARRLDLDLGLAIKNMSKGNKQKVGVVQAFMHRPELLLLDEPTSGLDPLMQRVVLELVGEAKARGAAVFFSSHILTEVEAVADRVGVIRGGVLVAVESPEALRKRSLRRVHVTFPKGVTDDWYTALDGVALVRRGDDSRTWTVNVTGDMTELLGKLVAAGACDLETERPSLEEVFLAFYDEPEEADA
ncbi:MAG: ABC transporter ATP-binding protein, partial [Nannocystaceae bacterium]|nr:ABC transporter ATP-binding protein [Nannocystaceae bacterium]